MGVYSNEELKIEPVAIGYLHYTLPYRDRK
jgi:hypothetical protein